MSKLNWEPLGRKDVIGMYRSLRAGDEHLAVCLRDMGHEYVTHMYNAQQGGFCWGHYFKKEELEEAKADFAERVARGY